MKKWIEVERHKSGRAVRWLNTTVSLDRSLVNKPSKVPSRLVKEQCESTIAIGSLYSAYKSRAWKTVVLSLLPDGASHVVYGFAQR